VFRAYQPEPGRLVAVKLFRLDVPPEVVHRLVAELEKLVAAELSHPGIAAPAGAGMSGVFAFLAQDFVAADSLDVIVREGQSSAPAVVGRLAAQLGSALDYAAEAGLFHGSLHPRDVLMSDDDVRMTGVGVARALTEVGISTPVRRPYSAPERAVGAPWDGRADMFSLAALCFELLYGRRVSGAGERAVASLPEIPGANRAALKRVFAKALAGDPSGRFPSGMAFADALQGALANASPVAVPLAFETESATAAVESKVAEGNPPKASEDSLAGAALEPSAPRPRATDSVPPMIGVAEDVVREVTLPAEREVTLPAEDLTLPAEKERDTELAGTLVALDLYTEDSGVTDHEPSIAADPALPAPDLDLQPEEPSTPPPFAAVALESTRSAVWPLVLALVVGIAIGFGFAMVFIGRQRPVQLAQQSVAPAPPAPTQVVDEPIVPVTEATVPMPPGAVARQGASVGPAGSMPAVAPSASDPPAARPDPPAPAPAQPEPVRSSPARPARQTGRIVVRSIPSGARVFLDGKSAGVTPLTVREVGAGVHAVRVTRDGYTTAERRVAVTDARPAASITVELARPREPARPAAPSTGRASRSSPIAQSASAAPAARSGALLVDSRPVGASVFIDGRLMGRTPLLLDEIEAREHAVSMEMAGYKRWTSSITVVGGARARIAASLEQ
jgi:serine/threonine protein kinase